MKKIVLGLILVLTSVAVFATAVAEEDDGIIRIGTSKIVEHPALNAVEQGIMDELAALGVEAEFDLQNAAGDMNTAAQIANLFKSNKVDVAVGIATPTAIALATNLQDIPVVFSAVTDPVDAGLVDNLTSGKNNVTGVSDMTPVAEQIKMLASAIDLKTLGHVYTAGEPNAVKLAELAEQTCKELGIEFIATSVANSSEVKIATESIVDKVDGIYVSTDNTVVSAFDSVLEVTTAAGVPVMSADPTSAGDYAVLAAYGFDYYNMGRVTGRIVKQILDGADPADMPTTFLTDPSDLILIVNLDVAAALGIELSDDFIAAATTVIQNGK